MPPKANKVAEDGTTAAIKVFLSVMKNCESVKPAWDSVAKEIGIGYGKNAASKFKGLVEKHGYKFEGGRVTLPDGEGDGEVDDDNDPATAAPSPALKSTKASKTRKSTTNKRKAAAVKDDTADEAPTKPAKKARKAASKDETTDEKPAKPATKTKKMAPKDDTAHEEPAKATTKSKKAAPKSDVAVKNEETVKNEADDQASEEGDDDDAKAKVETKVALVDVSDSSLLTPEEAADMV
ncbi:hypothetical protein LTR84_000509 [Exophiala bonariae]|uniref:Histone H1 n=1 Tax=Exophiala bonariae TaxID=1690606 RepID=A0AAV9NRA7_9EURO|nr:hypothetical protein LTR84_000509 [Exophiala bonariae]